MANATAFSSCVATADLAGDNEWRLVVAGADKKMKARDEYIDGPVSKVCVKPGLTPG